MFRRKTDDGTDSPAPAGSPGRPDDGHVVSCPTQVVHEGHLGFGCSGGLEARNLPSQWQSLLRALDRLLRDLRMRGLTRKESEFLFRVVSSTVRWLAPRFIDPKNPKAMPTTQQLMIAISAASKRESARHPSGTTSGSPVSSGSPASPLLDPSFLFGHRLRPSSATCAPLSQPAKGTCPALREVPPTLGEHRSMPRVRDLEHRVARLQAKVERRDVKLQRAADVKEALERSLAIVKAELAQAKLETQSYRSKCHQLRRELERHRASTRTRSPLPEKEQQQQQQQADGARAVLRPPSVPLPERDGGSAAAGASPEPREGRHRHGSHSHHGSRKSSKSPRSPRSPKSPRPLAKSTDGRVDGESDEQPPQYSPVVPMRLDAPSGSDSDDKERERRAQAQVRATAVLLDTSPLRVTCSYSALPAPHFGPPPPPPMPLRDEDPAYASPRIAEPGPAFPVSPGASLASSPSSAARARKAKPPPPSSPVQQGRQQQQQQTQGRTLAEQIRQPPALRRMTLTKEDLMATMAEQQEGSANADSEGVVNALAKMVLDRRSALTRAGDDDDDDDDEAESDE
eukprot:m51a1_g14475 hypothetical protein (570) ;mRNA; f:688981-691213